MADPWLGHRQRGILKDLSENNHGKWWHGCGWHYGGAHETASILESLVRHDLVRRTSAEYPTVGERSYQITLEGRAWLARNPRGR